MRPSVVMALLFALGACRGDGSDSGARTPASDTARPPAVLPADSSAALPEPREQTDVQPDQTGSGESGGDAATPRTAGRSGGSSAGPGPSSTAGADADGGAGREQEGAPILRRASAAYEAVRSIRADFVMNFENPLLKQKTTSRGTLYQRGPDLLAVRFSEPAGDLIVSDGEYFWVYYPSVDEDQVIRSPASSGGRSGVDLKAQFVGDPLERFSHTSHGLETVGGRRAHVLTLTPRQRAEYRSLKVWLDTDDALARRFEITEHNGSVRRFDLDDLRVNVQIPDATFRFSPPSGARIVSTG